MPYSALLMGTDRYINSTRYNIEWLKENDFECPECKWAMHAVTKSRYQRYHFFRHDSGNPKECTRISSESVTHENTKLWLMELLYKEDGFLIDYIADEVPFFNKNNTMVCKVDVLSVYKDGRKIAHEIQLSRQTKDRYTQRTIDRKEFGLYTIWYLGGNAYTKDAHDWSSVHNYGGQAWVLRYGEGDEPISAV